MSVSLINSATSRAAAEPAAQSQSQTQLPQQMLSQGDFLQLLVAQLSQQDPMDPVSDTDFAAQMAQFSALQESQTMQQNMAGIQAAGLLGGTATVQPGTGSPITGVVTAVQYSAGVPSVIIDGQSYALSSILSVSPTPTTPGTPTPQTQPGSQTPSATTQ
jgi:flagellar basal-body rod modification protein FlgD